MTPSGEEVIVRGDRLMNISVEVLVLFNSMTRKLSASWDIGVRLTNRFKSVENLPVMRSGVEIWRRGSKPSQYADLVERVCGTAYLGLHNG